MEHPAVGGLVRFQNRAVDVPGQGLFQGHSRSHPRGGGKVVNDQGPTLGAVDDHDGQVLQVGLPSHLHLGPQVGDQHAGHPHASSSRAGESSRQRPAQGGQRYAPGGAGNPGRVFPVLQDLEVVLRHRVAAQAAALHDFPDRGREGVAGGIVPDEREHPQLPPVQWGFPLQ